MGADGSEAGASAQDCSHVDEMNLPGSSSGIPAPIDSTISRTFCRRAACWASASAFAAV